MLSVFIHGIAANSGRSVNYKIANLPNNSFSNVQTSGRRFAAAKTAAAAQAVSSHTAASLPPHPCILRRSQINGHIIF
jgi:hypothetical protein